jgi:hypothetical protein
MDFKFEVTEQEANLIIQGLGELPAKISMNLIAKIQTQANEQLKNAPEIIDEDNNNV